MKNKLLKIVLFLFFVGGFAACEKNIEVTPISALDGSQGFKTKQDVDGALVGAYNALAARVGHINQRLLFFADLYADNLIHTGTFPTYAQIANRNILPNSTDVTSIWQHIYDAINRANTVIKAAPGITDPSFNLNNALGEARFLRAYNYMLLLAAFGGSSEGYNLPNGLGVPLIITPTLSVADAAAKPRNSETEVWALILEDLNFAVQNLANNNGLGRANKRVATALKARAHLFRGEWAQAETAANEVITTGGYTLVNSDSYADIWLKKNSTEAIWELQFDNVTSNAIAFFYYPTALGGRNEINSSPSLRDAHEANDVRKNVNYSVNPVGRTQKYTRVAGDDNVTIIRLPEMYLIRAEAAARLNKGDAARADINIIRKRAGLSDTTAQSEAELIDAIAKERRLEFAHEGHRWFDIRRLNRVASLGITQPFRALWPVPEREILTSEGIITQNPGY